MSITTIEQRRIDVLDHGFVRLVDAMGSDLSVVRAARVSHDEAWRAGEDEGSDAKLIRYLKKNKHHTPFEAVVFTFEVKAPIFVFRQWHRHRTWCLAGDTMISFERPDRVGKGIRTARKMRLDELYRKWSDNPPVKRQDKQGRPLQEFRQERMRGMLLRVYDEKLQRFTVGRIGDVISSGTKQVFEVQLEDGKKLKCSKDHLLLTVEGWQRLEDAVGLVLHGRTAGMIKQAIVLVNGYADVTTPWNKGVTGYKTSRAFSDTERASIRARRSGDRSNFWKGGVSSDRAKIAAWTTRMAPKVHAKFNYTCQAEGCGERGGRLHAHHRKPVVSHPELAFDFDNLVTLCVSCHDKEHGKTGEKRRSKGLVLRAMETRVVGIRYVGEEPTYDISVDGPNHNFVANGLIVHNSYNELSARYRELPEEVYMPPFRVQAAKNKQGSEGLVGEEDAAELEASFGATYATAFEAYRFALSKGVAREIARSVLPVATYSHMFGTVNLLNLMRFLGLRDHPHAQYEIRVYAEAMRELARSVAPVSIAAWEAFGT